MDKYEVRLFPQVYQELDEIYYYITFQLTAEGAAKNLIDKLEEAILNLSTFPQRGAERRKGAYSGAGYRQIFVKNFTIVYRIDEEKHQVLIVTVRYTPRQQ